MTTFPNKRPSVFGVLPSPALIADPPLKELREWWLRVKRYQTDLQTGIGQISDSLNFDVSTIVATIGVKNKISVSSVAPANPSINDLWIDLSDGGKYKFWDGLAWVENPDGVVVAAITNEAIVRANADGTLATQINAVLTGYQAADAVLQANITTETTARTNADSALASQITTVTADYIAADAVLQGNITNEQTARVNADSVLTTQISTVNANYQAADTTLQTNITNEQTARVNADNALGTQISSVTSSIGTKILVQNTAPATPQLNDLWLDTGDQNRYKFWNGSSWVYQQDGVLAAAVTQESNTRAAADGNLAGKYTLTVAAGNVVTGMNITSASGPGGNISDVTFVAANFKIYNGTTGVVMFNISGGNVKLADTLTVSTAGKVFIGAGNYNNSDTPFYVNSAGQLSLGNKLSFDGSNLSIAGNISGGSLTISNTGTIISNGVTGVMSGVGIFLGYEGGYHQFRVGDPGGAYIRWTGTQWIQNLPPGPAYIAQNSGGGSYSDIVYHELSPPLNVTAFCDGTARTIRFSGASLANASGAQTTCYLGIHRDGSPDPIASVGNGGGVVLASGQSIPIELTANDTPPAGNHTYSIRVKSAAGTSVASGGFITVL